MLLIKRHHKNKTSQEPERNTAIHTASRIFTEFLQSIKDSPEEIRARHTNGDLTAVETQRLINRMKTR